MLQLCWPRAAWSFYVSALFLLSASLEVASREAEIQQQSDFDCSGLDDGVYAPEGKCINFFYHCVDGETLKTVCEGESVYVAALDSCIPKSDIEECHHGAERGHSTKRRRRTKPPTLKPLLSLTNEQPSNFSNSAAEQPAVNVSKSDNVSLVQTDSSTKPLSFTSTTVTMLTTSKPDKNMNESVLLDAGSNNQSLRLSDDLKEGAENNSLGRYKSARANAPLDLTEASTEKTTTSTTTGYSTSPPLQLDSNLDEFNDTNSSTTAGISFSPQTSPESIGADSSTTELQESRPGRTEQEDYSSNIPANETTINVSRNSSELTIANPTKELPETTTTTSTEFSETVEAINSLHLNEETDKDHHLNQSSSTSDTELNNSEAKQNLTDREVLDPSVASSVMPDTTTIRSTTMMDNSLQNESTPESVAKEIRQQAFPTSALNSIADSAISGLKKLQSDLQSAPPTGSRERKPQREPRQQSQSILKSNNDQLFDVAATAAIASSKPTPKSTTPASILEEKSEQDLKPEQLRQQSILITRRTFETRSAKTSAQRPRTQSPRTTVPGTPWMVTTSTTATPGSTAGTTSNFEAPQIDIPKTNTSDFLSFGKRSEIMELSKGEGFPQTSLIIAQQPHRDSSGTSNGAIVKVGMVSNSGGIPSTSGQQSQDIARSGVAQSTNASTVISKQTNSFIPVFYMDKDLAELLEKLRRLLPLIESVLGPLAASKPSVASQATKNGGVQSLSPYSRHSVNGTSESDATGLRQTVPTNATVSQLATIQPLVTKRPQGTTQMMTPRIKYVRRTTARHLIKQPKATAKPGFRGSLSSKASTTTKITTTTAATTSTTTPSLVVLPKAAGQNSALQVPLPEQPDDRSPLQPPRQLLKQPASLASKTHSEHSVASSIVDESSKNQYSSQLVNMPFVQSVVIGSAAQSGQTANNSPKAVATSTTATRKPLVQPKKQNKKQPKLSNTNQREKESRPTGSGLQKPASAMQPKLSIEPQKLDSAAVNIGTSHPRRKIVQNSNGGNKIAAIFNITDNSITFVLKTPRVERYRPEIPEEPEETERQRFAPAPPRFIPPAAKPKYSRPAGKSHAAGVLRSRPQLIAPRKWTCDPTIPYEQTTLSALPRRRQTRAVSRFSSFSCTNKSDGNYEIPMKSCNNNYFRCRAGIRFVMACGPTADLVFVQGKDKCLNRTEAPGCSFYSSLGSLSSQDLSAAGLAGINNAPFVIRSAKKRKLVLITKNRSSQISQFNCKDRKDGFYADLGKRCSNNYFRCSGGVRYMQSCWPTQELVYVESLNNCVPRSAIPECSGGEQQPNRFGFESHPRKAVARPLVTSSTAATAAPKSTTRRAVVRKLLHEINDHGHASYDKQRTSADAPVLMRREFSQHEFVENGLSRKSTLKQLPPCPPDHPLRVFKWKIIKRSSSTKNNQANKPRESDSHKTDAAKKSASISVPIDRRYSNKRNHG